jgi:polar amino acid transport system substrate-binding protein
MGVIVGSEAGRLLNTRGWPTVPYAFEHDLLADLEKAKLDAGAVSIAKVSWYVPSRPGSRVRFFHDYDNEPELNRTVAVGLLRCDSAPVEAVNAALARIKQDGQLNRIYARYGIEYRPPAAD